jgi:hypothetical protein
MSAAEPLAEADKLLTDLGTSLYPAERYLDMRAK